MVNKYPKVLPSKNESQMAPSIKALKFILDYSKSLEVKSKENTKVMYLLN